MITNEQRDLKLEWYYNSNILKQEIRSYEVSLWTLQDEFITVLKWSDTEQKGRVEKPIMTIGIDGTQNFECTIPMYIRYNGELIENPNWYTTRNGNLITDLRKIKVILNKGTEDEGIFEFVITSITETHENEEMNCNITASGLAFHELGRIGYKISLSQDTFLDDLANWTEESGEDKPEQTIQYWLKQIGIDPWNENDFEANIWYYEVQMDWSSFREGTSRDTDKIYEEAYTTVWSDDLKPLATEEYREKWRPISVENSNIYNITQNLAETFGVFCRYEYLYDENYHIVGRKIIFYNNFIQEGESAFSLTYPYSSSKVSRTLDSTDLTTKLYVLDVDNSATLGGKNTIMNAEANATHEDYLLNFEYLYKIGAINQEQYDAIHDFNVLMRDYNEQLIPLYEDQSAYENKEVEVEAQKAVYEKGQDLAAEQITENSALRNAIDVKDGNADGLVTRTVDNPAVGTINVDTVNGNYINLAYGDKGIKTDTVKIYRTYSSTNKTLSSQITRFYFEYDEFGNPTKIKGQDIVVVGTNTQIYMIYDYEPQLYYDAIIKVWQAKYAKDHAGFLEQSELLEDIQETLEDYQETIEELEKEKRQAVKKFDAMMGPALREGYWQPEDYTDYGNQLSATLTMGNTSSDTTLPETDTGIGCLFGWDTVLFDGEEDIYYQQGVEQTKYYYPCINLSSIYNQIAANIDQYSFIFNNNYYKSDADTTSVQYTQNFQVGSQAIVRFVKQGNNIFPALILLGAKSMTDGQIAFMKRATSSSTPGGNPRIGIFNTSVNTSTGVITTSITNAISVTNSSFWQFDGSDISSCKVVYPRIKFSSLDLKTGEDNVSIKYNNTQLVEYEDYYVKTRVHPTSYKLEYLITLQPQSIMKSGATTGTINIDYTISNANTQIYLDAMAVMKENSMPKVSYEVSPSIINHSMLRTLYQKLAHLVMINDADLKFKNTFGYISEIKLDLEEPQNDSIEVKNYKTKFEDLFSNIVAQTESMQCVSGQIAAMVQGKLPLNVDGLAGSLEGLENVTFFNSFLDNYINNSQALDEKLAALFTEASEVLSSSNKALQQVHTLSTKNASILSSFASNIADELNVKVYRSQTRPDEFKVGDVWIRVNEWGAEQARYVAVVSSSEQLGMAATAPGFETSGFIRTYDGTLASITGAGLSIDAQSGTVKITAANLIDIQSGNDIDIRANSTVNIHGNDMVNIGGTTINIGSTTIDGSTVTGGVNIIATAYTELKEQYGSTTLSKVLIHPDKIEMGGSDILMRGANKIQMVSSRGTYATSALEIGSESGIWMGSTGGVTIYSGNLYAANGTKNTAVGINGASVELNANHLMLGYMAIHNDGNSTAASGSAVELTRNYIVMAVGSNYSSSASVTGATGGLTGMKITSTSIGLATIGTNTLNSIIMNNLGITLGAVASSNTTDLSSATDSAIKSLSGSAVRISGTGIILTSTANLYVNTSRFVLDTSQTGTNNILTLKNSSNTNVLTFSETNGLSISGSVTATSFIASSTKGQMKVDANSFGFYDTSGNALLTINGTTISAGGDLAITAGKNFSLNAGGVTINTGASSGTLFSVMKNNKGITVDTAGNLTVTGTINATGGTFSGTITASGTISGGTISGATITGGSLNIGNGACTIDSDGYLYASDAYIGGEINSSAGTIGGWTIGANGLRSGSLLLSDSAIGYCLVAEGTSIGGTTYTYYSSTLYTGISSDGVLKIRGTEMTDTDIQHLQTLWTAYNTPTGNDYMTYEDFYDELVYTLNNDENVRDIIVGIVNSANGTGEYEDGGNGSSSPGGGGMMGN